MTIHQTASPDVLVKPSTDAVTVSGLRVSYETKSGARVALHSVDLLVPRGRVLAIVGESGSGKSTLAHALIRLLPDNASIDSGTIFVDGTDVTPLPEREMRRIRGSRIGFVPQDPMMSLNPTKKIGPQVEEAIALHQKLPKSEMAARVSELLTDAGLSEPTTVVNKYPHELSGGMRQRVLIAIAFACSPSVIIADEPTSALDATVSNHVLDTLQRKVRENSSTLVIITHDLALAARRATDVIVMSQGRVVESGTAAKIFENPQHAYTKALVESSLQLRPRAPRTLDQTTSSDVVVSVSNICKRYGPDSSPLSVDGVSFEVTKGSTFALVGESGSGKSTTVRMILGLESITGGRADVFGQNIGGLSKSQIRDLYQRMQVIYQSPFASLDPKFSLEQIIEEPLRSFRIGDKKSRQSRVMELLDRVGVPRDYAHRKPRELSGGQRQRVAIARALAISPDLVVCDEPVSALDASVQAQILDLLLEIQQDLGVTYIFISHDLAVVADIAHNVGVMRGGRMVEAGTAREIFSNPQHAYTKSLLASSYGEQYSGTASA